MSTNEMFIKKVYIFYRDGFKSMTLGKTLWVIILIKLFIFFVIVRLLFFPNFLNQKADNDNEKSEYVGKELIERGLK